MRILLVEDDDVIARQVKRGLERAEFEVERAADGQAGMALADTGEYDLVILDLMLPRRSGWEVCEHLRRARQSLPILMLTARDTVDDRVRGLDLGADDYLTKPFDFQELLARVRALLRRDRVNKARVIRIADLEIDTAARTVRRGGDVIHLTPHEYALLEALAAYEGRVLSRETILERVWRDEHNLSDTVSFHVRSLRQKIDAGREPRLIHTIHGVGYVLRAHAGGQP